MDKNDNHIGRICFIVMLILFILIPVRLLIVQSSEIINSKRYSDPDVSYFIVRGTIYDRNGYILAIQSPDYGFNVSLKDSSASYIASVISPYIPYTESKTVDLINSGVSFIPLSFVPTRDEKQYLKELLINYSLDDELEYTESESRKYPVSTFMEKIIGETDSNMNGISGIEELYNSELEARPMLGESVVKGSSLVLTIDANLEFEIQRIVQDIDENATVAIVLNDNELIAYQGEISNKVLDSMVYSITDESGINYTENSFDNSLLPSSSEYNFDSYKVYISSVNNTDQIQKAIHSILVMQSRIKD